MGLYEILNTPVSRRTALKLGAGVGLGAAVTLTGSGCEGLFPKTKLSDKDTEEITSHGYTVRDMNTDYKIIEKGDVQALIRTNDIGIVVLLRGRTAEAKKYYNEEHPAIRALSEMSAEALRAYGDKQPYINQRLADALADLNGVDKRDLEPGQTYKIPCIIYDGNGLDRLDSFLRENPTFKSYGLSN